MARPKQDLIQLHIRLNQDILKKIDNLANDMDMNRTDTIKYLLKYSVNALIPEASQDK